MELLLTWIVVGLCHPRLAPLRLCHRLRIYRSVPDVTASRDDGASALPTRSTSSVIS